MPLLNQLVLKGNLVDRPESESTWEGRLFCGPDGIYRDSGSGWDKVTGGSNNTDSSNDEAFEIAYDNSTTGMSATDVQSAIDELFAEVQGVVPVDLNSADVIGILPATNGGTGLSALAANVVSFLGAADYSAMRTQLSLVPGTDIQAYDGDLAALAALSGTNNIYYRSAANTWTSVTIGSGLTFSGGTLAATGGGGSPGGSNTQVQFNDGGSFGGDSNFTFDKTNDVLTTGVMVINAAVPSDAASRMTFDFTSGTGRIFSYGADTSTQGKFLLRSNRSTFASGSVDIMTWDTAKLVLGLSGTSYFHVGAAAYGLSSYTVFHSLQIPYAKTDTTLRNGLMVCSNDSSTPFGLNIALTGHASNNNRLVILSSTTIGTALEIMRFSAYTYEFTSQADSNIVSSKITGTSSVTTVEAVPSNAGVHIKPNGTGFIHHGASAYATSAYSVYHSMAIPFAKSDSTSRNAFFVGSNDSNPFGLIFTIQGNATSTSRIAQIGVTEIGVNGDGQFRLLANDLRTYHGNGVTLGATFNSTGITGHAKIIATTEVQGAALVAKGGTLSANSASTSAHDHWAAQNWSRWFSQGPDNSTNGKFRLHSCRADGTNEIDVMDSDTSGNLIFAGSIKTAAPSSGTSGVWKLGIRVAATVAFDTSQYIQLDVGGTLYKVAIAS